MVHTLTLTSKGQATIPVEIRRQLHVPSDGGRLQLEYREDLNGYLLRELPSIEDASNYLRRFIPEGTPPLMNVHEFIETEKAHDYAAKYS